MNTFDLIEKYLFAGREHYKGLRLENYVLNGTIIKINYSYEYDWSEVRSYDSDNYIFVELLDYITFVFNNK